MDITQIILLTIVIAVVLFVATTILKKKKLKDMIACIQKGDTEGLEKNTDSTLCKILFPRFNLHYLKLNAYILEGNKRKINDLFDELLNTKKTKAQTEDVTMKAFNYYVGMEDKHRTKELITEIETFNNERMKEEARIIYDVFIQKKSNYIEQMEEDLKTQTIEQKALTEYLLSVQYKNAGNNAKAKEYEKLSKRDLNVPLKDKKAKK